jgi:hypothetical protein
MKFIPVSMAACNARRLSASSTGPKAPPMVIPPKPIRANTSRDKARKDIAQAETLIEALLEDHPDDLMDAWSDLTGRGRKWKTEAMKSVRNLPKLIQEVFTSKVELNS